MPRAKKKPPRKRAARAAEIVTDLYAARMHNAWRRAFRAANPKVKALPRMRERGGVMVDVNQPWDKLHPKAKADNLRAARAAYAAVMKYPNDREAAADYVHKQWIARNKGDASQPRALFKPYAALPEDEKDKDRAHVDRMKRALASARKAPKRRPTKKSARGVLAFSAQDWRRLERARNRLERALGGDLSMETLIVASAEAVTQLAAALPRPKARRR